MLMKYLFFLGLLFSVWACSKREPQTLPIVRYAGTMQEVVEAGDTSAHIYLDTINPHRRLYGLGVLKGNSGEILIIDGRPYASKLNAAGLNRIRMTYKLHASHLVYTHVRDWQAAELPEDSVVTKHSLGKYLEALAVKRGLDVSKPFPFMLTGTFQKIDYHVSYLEKINKSGTKKRPQTNYTLSDANIIILGFFSKKHQGIFTEPGSDVVMGFMTTTASKIGQIDQLTLKGSKVQLLLPE